MSIGILASPYFCSLVALRKPALTRSWISDRSNTAPERGTESAYYEVASASVVQI